MFVIIWKELGFGIVLCLARLSSVSEEYFESARVDGARWWRIFRHITIPQLAPALVFYAIIELINMLSWVFAYIYVMTLGGPMNSTVVTEYYIFQQVFTNNVVGVGSAAGVVRSACPARISTLVAAAAIQPPKKSARIEVSRRIVVRTSLLAGAIVAPEQGPRQAAFGAGAGLSALGSGLQGPGSRLCAPALGFRLLAWYESWTCCGYGRRSRTDAARPARGRGQEAPGGNSEPPR